jgi:HK97 family phage prohead protease
MVDRRTLIDAPERRAIAASDFEMKKAGDSLVLTGYASVFDHPYDILGGAPRGWTETVDRRAFDVTLAGKPDVHLLINHEGMPLARTKSGTLQLGTDARGLLVTANLDRKDPDVQRLETKMQRGDMDEMSFAFRVKADDWSDDDSQRRLTEVSLHKGDVSVVNFGANPATNAELNSIRSALDLLADMHPDTALAELRSTGSDVVTQAARAAEALSVLRRRLAPPRAARRMTLAEARAVIDDLGGIELRAALPVHHTPTVDASWDGPAAVAAMPNDDTVLRYCFAWQSPDAAADPHESGDDDADDQKSNYKFPHHAGKGAPANLNGVRNALARLANANIPAGDRAGVEAHLRAHLNDAQH